MCHSDESQQLKRIIERNSCVVLRTSVELIILLVYNQTHLFTVILNVTFTGLSRKRARYYLCVPIKSAIQKKNKNLNVLQFMYYFAFKD